MHRLTREVRFGLPLHHGPGGLRAGVTTGGTNAFAAKPPLEGLGLFWVVRVTLSGEVDPQSQYVRNIQDIDSAVREVAVPLLRDRIAGGSFGGGGIALRHLIERLGGAFPGSRLEGLELRMSPFLALTWTSKEPAMVRLSQRFEFSAAHRLHNPALSDADNVATFGKCNNPLGHGHNYEVQVTVAGEPGPDGVVVPVGTLERIVEDRVIRRFDHKHLNVEVPEFAATIPSVENIARVIFGLLRPAIPAPARLASVTVWETPKTWCEYTE